jgi:hypothetical protein
LLGQGRVQVINWHRPAAQTDPKRGVVRLGDESPAAFARRVLDTEGTIGRKRRLLVLNDESHHAYRRAADARVRRDEKDDVERATIWIEGLERIHHDREILVTPTDEAKEGAARRWIAAVNADGRWGTWSHVVIKAKADVRPAIDAALAVAVSPLS